MCAPRLRFHLLVAFVCFCLPLLAPRVLLLAACACCIAPAACACCIAPGASSQYSHDPVITSLPPPAFRPPPPQPHSLTHNDPRQDLDLVCFHDCCGPALPDARRLPFVVAVPDSARP